MTLTDNSSVPVALTSRTASAAGRDEVAPTPRVRRQLRLGELLTNFERAQLALFFAKLAVKEHVAPRLHVRPLVAELFLTDNCNLRCVTCACWRTTTRHELTTDEWRDVIDQLVDLRIVKLNFTGGEPLVRRDTIELIAYARTHGVKAVHLNTNGILLTPARRRLLLAAGVRSFNISLDGHDAITHDAIRGIEGSFVRTTANLRALLLEGGGHRLRVRLNFTVQRSNVRFLPDIARLAQELGVQLYLNLATDTTFLFRHADVSAEAQVGEQDLRRAIEELEAIAGEDSRWLPRFSDRRYVAAHFADRLQSALPCAESQLKLMIRSTGEVGGCWGHDPHDNLRERSIAEIIASGEYRSDHARYFRKECVGCGSNYSLNLRWRPTTYWADGVNFVKARARR